MDTNNTGGNLTPGTVQQVGIGGQFGVPTTGVSAVAVTITVIDPTAAGSVFVQPNGAGSPTVAQLSFGSGERVSNTAMVAVSADVKLQVSVAVKAPATTVSTRVLIDVQGYYSTGNGTVAPGGFVANPAGGQRVADTRYAGGVLAQNPLSANSSVAVNVTGQAGIPSTATAVFANITVISYDSGEGYITPYRTGMSPRPNVSLNYPGITAGTVSKITALASVVDLDANEQFTLYVGTGSTQAVDVAIDIEGYFDDSDTKAAFTPGSARVYDTTTSTNLRMGINEVREVQVSGLNGVPSASTGIGVLAVEMTTISTDPATSNHVQIWGHDQTMPDPQHTTANNSNSGAVTRSNLSLVVPGASSDTVFIRNSGNATMDVQLDVEGWYATPANLPAAAGGNCAASGQRSSSHQIPHQLTDKLSMAWNPVNGNLNLREPLIHLTGVGQSIDLGLRYNSVNDTRPSLSAGWTESAITVNPVNNTVVYTGPDGACYIFTKKAPPASSGNIADYNTPPYVNATLNQKDADTFTLRMNPSGVTNTYSDKDASGNFTSVWALTQSADSTGGNLIKYAYDTKNRITSITEDNYTARSLSFTYADARNPLQPSKVTDTSLNRILTFTYAGPAGAMDTLTDADNDKITFGYGGNSGNQITSIQDNNGGGGIGNTTTVAYEAASTRRVNSWTYAAVTGATTASTYTASYPHGTQTTTTLTDALHPATTFAFDHDTAASGRAPAGIGTAVVTITDALGHPTNFDYNPHGDVEKTTNALGQTASSNYGGANYLVNSTTAASSAGAGGTPVAGASTFLNYPGDDRSTTAKDQDGANVAPCAAASTPLGNYRPCNSTDAQGHVSTYTYDSVSQNVATATSSSSNGQGGTQSFTYQGGAGAGNCPHAHTGQLCSSTDGDSVNGTHKTTYAYDTTDRGDLVLINRPANLGDIVMTYDAAGRIATRTDGNGHKLYFTYDNDDRVTKTTVDTTTCAYDSTNSCVEYLYDNAGNLIARGDRSANTITTFTHDQQNRLIRQYSANRSTSAVTADSRSTYDAIGNRTSNTDVTADGDQTVTYGYDTANRNVWLAEPGTASCPVVTAAQTSPTAGCVLFLYDDANRRTDTYEPNGRDNHVDYDTAGHPTYLDNRPYGGNTYGATAGRSYAYTSGPNSNGSNTAGGLVSATGTASGAYTSYFRYDGMNHLIDQGGVTSPDDAHASSYWHYDHNGNRTQATTTGTGGTTTYATYNDANQLCWTGTVGTDQSSCGSTTTGSTTYTYDTAGNMTGFGPLNQAADHTYSYSSFDQMTGSNYGGATASYDYADITSDERTQAGNDTIDNGLSGVGYVVEGSKQVEYIRDPTGTLIEMRVKGTTPWQTQYYSLDRLGSVILLTTTTGATAAQPTYDAWGVTTSAAPTNAVAALNRYGYASGYTDGTGLIKYGTRYYNPSLGVWTQGDPSAKGANYYIYAASNPITNADPTGRDDCDSDNCDEDEDDCDVDCGLGISGVGLGLGEAAGEIGTVLGEGFELGGLAAGLVGGVGLIAAVGAIGLIGYGIYEATDDDD